MTARYLDETDGVDSEQWEHMAGHRPEGGFALSSHACRALNEGERTPTVCVSFGMGLDSSALLVRWLTDPSTRDFGLEDMVVLTAMTGHEFDCSAAHFDWSFPTYCCL